MKLIESKAEILQQKGGLDGLYKHIELCGRTAYKSEDKITIDSAKPFVERMIKSKHGTVLEHNAVYLKMSDATNDENYWILVHSPYAETVYHDGWNYITTNLRAIIELFPNIWNGFLNTYICEPTEYHIKRYTFKVTTSIGVSREFNRSRSLSVVEQSTRWCNYTKDKFDNQISFCKPTWLNLNLGQYELLLNPDRVWDNHIAGDGYLKSCVELSLDVYFLKRCLEIEMDYKQLIEIFKYTPQQAREILPLCTATEVCYTGFSSDWRHFFDLRLFEKTGKVHPNAKYAAQLMKEAAEKAGIWEDIMKQPSKFE